MFETRNCAIMALLGATASLGAMAQQSPGSAAPQRRSYYAISEIHVDQDCRILPDAAYTRPGKKPKPYTDENICHLEGRRPPASAQPDRYPGAGVRSLESVRRACDVCRRAGRPPGLDSRFRPAAETGSRPDGLLPGPGAARRNRAPARGPAAHRAAACQGHRRTGCARRGRCARQPPLNRRTRVRKAQLATAPYCDTRCLRLSATQASSSFG
jgi:hypothetical protein